jgi:xanthine dehydrogenase YagR molybdenum-binding subunit
VPGAGGRGAAARDHHHRGTGRVNHDFAGYHIAAHADVGAVEADWIEESDSQLNPLGVKGPGEVGIVGAAAAIANAAWHATGRRQRHLPLVPGRMLA